MKIYKYNHQKHSKDVKKLICKAFEMTSKEYDKDYGNLQNVFGYIIIDDNKIVSAIMAYNSIYLSTDVVYIYALVTYVKYRGKGYASKLLQKFIDIYIKKNIPITLRIEYDKPKLIDYYKKFGFKKTKNINFMGNYLYILK